MCNARSENRRRRIKHPRSPICRDRPFREGRLDPSVLGVLVIDKEMGKQRNDLLGIFDLRFNWKGLLTVIIKFYFRKFHLLLKP